MRRRWPFFLAVAVVSGVVAATPTSALAFRPLAEFGSHGPGAGQLQQGAGIAIGLDGLAYIADSQNGRIDVFTPTGTFIRAFGKKVNPAGGDVCTTECQAGEERGEGAGALISPQDVVLDPAGNVYVADYGNSRIDVFSGSGNFLYAFGKEVGLAGGGVCTTVSGCQRGSADESAGAVSNPLGLGIDAAGDLFVGTANNRIDVFTSGGGFLYAFGKGVDPGGGDVCTLASGCQSGEANGEAAGAMWYPHDVAFGPGGQLAVADSANYRIDVFTPTGTFIRAFGKEVNPAGGDLCTAATGCRAGVQSGAAGGFYFTNTLAVDSAGNLYVGDVSNNRIDELTFGGTFIRAFGEGVVNGAHTFQVCLPSTGCRSGYQEEDVGSVPLPFGVAVDCAGAVYAVEETTGPFSRVGRYGEPDTPLPPCDGTEPEPEDEGEPEGEPEPEPEDEGEPKPEGGQGATSPSSPSPPSAPSVPPSPKLTRETRPTGIFPGGFRIAGLNPNLKQGTATLLVDTKIAARLVLEGRGIRKVERRAKGAGRVKLPVEPVGHLMNLLDRTGKVEFKARLTFKPLAPVQAITEMKLKLKKVSG